MKIKRLIYWDRINVSRLCLKGPEGGKWEPGFAHFVAGKWDFMHRAGIHQPKNNRKWEWDKDMSKASIATKGFVQWHCGTIGFRQIFGWKMGKGSPLQDALSIFDR